MSLSSLSTDLEAVESRLLSEAPEYKTLMQAGGAGGAARLGQTRLGAATNNLNNLWLQYGQQYGQQYGGQYGGQNMYNSRKGAGSGSEQAATSSELGAAYSDYDYADYDYNLGGLAANRRQGQGGLGGYGNIGQWDYAGAGLSRQYGGSGLGVGYGGSGYSPVSLVSGYGPGVCEDKGLNPFLVLATVAGAALAFFVIYRQITTGGKRNLNPTANEFFEHFSSLVWSGE